jgi:hypothetical protein
MNGKESNRTRNTAKLYEKRQKSQMKGRKSLLQLQQLGLHHSLLIMKEKKEKKGGKVKKR